ncbi:DUF2628 domain-containing protein [Jiella avicenniae]|uniref:DUF2628 domain-containing protein n=1 Tax=Jiella avicenniae TaxID=2907202 RepID=A0A9X1P2B0_9HYPH|nr:DUF2628 domain-containing protein [Jiella avicenniae]MCE7028846.1 DUF2628 domain-containing protein [Jiella avicenniae]
MSRYVVFEPPEAVGPSDAAIFLRDRFSFLAFVFTFLWMFRYGLWVSGLVTIAILVALNLLGTVQGFELSAALISVLLGVLIGLEGPSLRAARLRRNGWNDVAAFEAQNTDEAELIYYCAAETAAIEPPVSPATPSAPVTPAAPAEPAASSEPGGPAEGAMTAEEPAVPAATVPTSRGEARPTERSLADDAPSPTETVETASTDREAPTTTDPSARLKTELERSIKVEGWAERWDKPGVEVAKLSGGRRRPVGRL